jgi:hypothetical protein
MVRRRARTSPIAAALLLFACGASGRAPETPAPASAEPLEGAPEVPAAPGVAVDFQAFAACTPFEGAEPSAFRRADPGPDWAIQPAGVADDRAGWGLAVDDFDGDGHLDVFLPEFGQGQLFLGDGAGGLRAAHERLPPLPEPGMSASAADLDSDGDPDLVIGNNGAPNTVLINEGGWFQRHSAPESTWGTAPVGLGTQSQTIGDIDGDSILDVIFATFYAPEAVPEPELHPNTAFVGDGAGCFAPSPNGLPADAIYTPANTVGLIDFNEDGALDLFVINDKPAEFTAQAYEGDGQGRFRALPAELGLRVPIQGMGLAEGDLNGDGTMDYAITGWDEIAVLLSDGRGGWAESSRALGVVAREGAPVGWGLDFEDIDLDGDLDIVVANGPPYDVYGRIGRGPIPNPPVQPWAVFVQGSDGAFTEAADALGLGAAGRRRGFVFADLDEDGQPELIARELANGAAEVWAPACRAEAALEVRLEDAGGNRRAIGAQLELQVDGRRMKRAIRASTTNIASSSPPIARFGLGLEPGPAALTVRWPDGERTVLTDVPTDGVLTVRRAP